MHPELKIFMMEADEGAAPLNLIHFWSMAHLHAAPTIVRLRNPYQYFQETKVKMFRHAGHHVFILIPPRPTQCPECHMIALVQDSESVMTGEDVRPAKAYFTLEQASMAVDSAMLCAWTPDRHVNFGPTTNISVDAFSDFIRACIDNHPS